MLTTLRKGDYIVNDLDSKIAEEIDDEALFRLAEGEEREFSQEYQQNMNQLYRKATAHPKRKMKPVRKIIAIAAIIAMLTGAAAATTFWEEIQQFFVSTFGRYIELQVDPGKEIRKEQFTMIPEDWNSFWLPNPDDYEYSISTVGESGKRKAVTFLIKDSELKLYQWTGNGGIRVDNDATAVPNIYVNHKEAYATEKSVDGTAFRTIFWTTEEMSFELRGLLPFDELTLIADSIVLIER